MQTHKQEISIQENQPIDADKFYIRLIDYFAW